MRDVAVGARGQGPAGELVGARDCPRHPVQGPRQRSEDRVGQEVVVEPLAPAGERFGLAEGYVEPVVGLDLHPVGVGEPVEVGMVVPVDDLVVRRQRLVPGGRPFVGLQDEQRLDLEGQLGEDAEGAQADPGEVEDVRVLVAACLDYLAGSGDQLEAGELCGQAGGDATGAVGAGGHRPGQGLLGDVAHVVQAQAQPFELFVEGLQRGPGPAVTVIASRSTFVMPVIAVGRSIVCSGDRDPREAVPGPDHLDGLLLGPRLLDGFDDLLAVPRFQGPCRVCRLQA